MKQSHTTTENNDESESKFKSIDHIIGELTLEEKVRLLSGDGWWQTHGIRRIGIPPITLTDGPHGIRKSLQVGLGKSVPATCFPTASALAASWNEDLLQEVGLALSREAQEYDVQILLGPGVNMKRSPLGGRNFEYFSEDPLLAGKLAAAYIRGVQSGGVGTSIKHFAVNNQEFERMANSSNVDERTLHEIYLRVFEIAIKEGKPWTVMSAYNMINGVYASENAYLLEKILRQDWGFEGFVVSDWGAVNDRVAGLLAGLNLEMPGSGDLHYQKILKAVHEGQISPQLLDLRVSELVRVIYMTIEGSKNKRGNPFNREEHHALARKVAGECIVLLKNDDQILPLNFYRKGKNTIQKVAIIGEFARYPRYQGAGSSQVNPTQLVNAFDELQIIVKNIPAADCGEVSFTYARGYDEEGCSTDQLLREAKHISHNADVAIVFIGLPDSYEAEGFDRKNLSLPQGHIDVLSSVIEAQSQVIVVLMNGSAVEMPWLDRPQVKAVLEGWLTGQAGGGAIADVLTGKVNPSGKLAETFPMKLEDTPTYPHFPGLRGQSEYGEGVFMGYRYYDKKKIRPLFPFGFGLSYTQFSYSDFRITNSHFRSDDLEGEICVSVRVRNVGEREGKEVVQLYIGEENPLVVRPNYELKSFKKIALSPGEEKEVNFKLKGDDFAFYDPKFHQWKTTGGPFKIYVGSSSRDLSFSQTLTLTRKKGQVEKLTRHSMVKEFLHHHQGKDFHDQLLQAVGFKIDHENLEETQKQTQDQVSNELSYEEKMAKKKTQMTMMAFLEEMPVDKLPAFSQGAFTDTMLDEILAKLS